MASVVLLMETVSPDSEVLCPPIPAKSGDRERRLVVNVHLDSGNVYVESGEKVP